MSDPEAAPSGLTQDLILRRQANDNLPVSTIPSELLVRIFDWLRPKTAGDLWRGQWVVCTHVCHHWRTVAFSAPILWNRVAIKPRTPEEGLKTWIDRCGMATFSVSIRDEPRPTGGHKGVPEFLVDHIWRELYRIKSLALFTGSKTYSSRDWPDSMPVMEDLELFLIDRDGIDLADELERFPRNLRDRFPGLKRLRTVYSTFDFRHWILPRTLTQLSIVGAEATPPRHTLDNILQALGQLPFLEHLQLDNALPSSVIAENHADRSMALNSLQYLELSGRFDEQLTLLRAMELGSSVRLRLHLIMHNSFAHADSLLTTSFSTYLRKMRPLHAAMIYIQGAPGYNHGVNIGTCELTVLMWADLQAIEPKQQLGRLCGYSQEPLIEISFLVPEDTVDLSPELANSSLAPLERLLSKFPISNVRSATMDCMSGPAFTAPLVWRTMEKLETLSIFGGTHTGEGLLGVLKQLDLAQVIGDHAIVFPNLRTVTLSRVQCRDALGPFVEMLGRRRQLQNSGLGSPAELNVVLKYCFCLNRSAVEDLAQIAVVEWDGLEVEDSNQLWAAQNDV